ncbi:hypothetical protein HBI70_077240 [Parastagonospora nodorum]|nr:hypothetical protein HBI10_136060 [Parastagonospora nodorum]KAH4020554.1 hypothetical protein HBI13_116410 [Parastagonospora nodorum]KAH4119263.1 hypothetical protein HBH47_129180 [Parastagonospora nodorum]KAH4412679.1 hypothetical protein HBH92_098720 [Parastagonospora nodorum]KAH4427822.1 hypothetical protein HBH93_167960 [Parastagonospora nodorum]
MPGDLWKYRVVIRDSFGLAGVKTPLCSKAYHAIYPRAAENAVAIADLIDRGLLKLRRDERAGREMEVRTGSIMIEVSQARIRVAPRQQQTGNSTDL